MFDHQLRGLIWLKFALRTYSFTPDETQLIASTSAAAQPWLCATPQASRFSGGASGAGTPEGVPSSGCQRTPRRASNALPELAGACPTGLRSTSSTLKSANEADRSIAN